MAFGYVYQTTNATLIASLDGLPQGIDADGLFTLHTRSQVYENVSVNDTFDFSGEDGGGIRWFAITGVGPVDAADPAAFPIQMTFTDTADVCVTPLRVPELTITGTRLADPGDFRRPCGLYVDVSWNAQPELAYRLETSDDMVSWTTANTIFVDPWIQSGGASAFTYGSSAYYRVQVLFMGPNLKYGGGGGPVIVTPPDAKPFWPWGIPTSALPPVDGFNEFSVLFATVGDAGNDPDSTGFGRVDAQFRMSAWETSRGMIESYNAAVDPNMVITMADMTDFGGNGANQPATGISWNEAARFVNWLNTSKGFPPAYKFAAGGGVNDAVQLWQPGDSGYHVSNPYRNRNAVYFIPSEDEWYKAAYHNAGGSGYFDYPTGSNSQPAEVAGGTVAETAVWKNQPAPAAIDQAGGWSPHGTMAQGGNVWEWTESAFDGSNDSGTEDRTTRGGSWSGAVGLHAGSRIPYGPSQEDRTTGFRIASRALNFSSCP